MKKLVMALALAVAPLSACTTTEALQNAPVIGNVCSAADRVLIDEKVVFAAQTLYNIPADAYKRAFLAGQIPASRQSELYRGLVKLDQLRVAIRNARGAVNCDFAAMQRLHTDVIKLLPKG